MKLAMWWRVAFQLASHSTEAALLCLLISPADDRSPIRKRSYDGVANMKLEVEDLDLLGCEMYIGICPT